MKYIKAVPGKGITASTIVSDASTVHQKLDEALESDRSVQKVRLRDASGFVLGTYSREDAIKKFGSSEVTGWYTESRDEATVWISVDESTLKSYVEAVSDADDLDFKSADDIKEFYNADDTMWRLYNEAKAHLNEDAGYRAYYDLEKYVVDNNRDTNILFDLGADFAWDSRLDDAVNQLALEDGREDLMTTYV